MHMSSAEPNVHNYNTRPNITFHHPITNVFGSEKYMRHHLPRLIGATCSNILDEVDTHCCIGFSIYLRKICVQKSECNQPDCYSCQICKFDTKIWILLYLTKWIYQQITDIFVSDANEWYTRECLTKCEAIAFIYRLHYELGIGFIRHLTHWGRVTHRCVGKLTIIGSDNGLSPERRQAIIWTNAGILLIGHLGTNFSEILVEIQTFSLKKIRLKMSSAKCCSFRLGLNVF